MITREVILDKIQKSVSANSGSSSFTYKMHSTGEIEFFKEEEECIMRFGWRLLHKSEGYEIDQLSATIRYKPLEYFLDPIVHSHGFNSSAVTLRNSTDNNRELFMRVCSAVIKDLTILEKLTNEFIQYLNIEILSFFKSRRTLQGLGEFILSKNFPDLINIGIGGEYPVNILKAITIAKWCKNDLKYNEFINGFQGWIEEDRKDANFAGKCESYQRALDDLVRRLENR